MTIFFLIELIKNMIVTSYNLNSYYNQYKINKPSFEAKKPLDLTYILKNREHLLPERIAKEIKKILFTQSNFELPTLKEVHLMTYEPLLHCKTLQEAKELFPEFNCIKEVTEPFKKITGNIKILQDEGHLRDGFSLELLQEIWGKLANLDDVAEKFGLYDRHSMDWILKKIEFVKYDKNYKNLVISTTPEGYAKKAEQTKAWNMAHPDLMYAKNQKAAQGNKKPEHRKAQSERMKNFYNEHPEERERVSKNSTKYWSDPENRKDQSDRIRIYAWVHPEKGQKCSRLAKSAWDMIPEGREMLRSFYRDYVAENKVLGAQLKYIFKKIKAKQDLTPAEEIIYNKYNKACAEANTDVWKMLSEAFSQLRNEK